MLLCWCGVWTDERELPLQPLRTVASTLAPIGRLAPMQADPALAEELNHPGLQTATGLTFTAKLVASLREQHNIPARGKLRDTDSPTVSLSVAAGELGVSVASLYRWIDQGLVAAEQERAGTPLRGRLDSGVWAEFRETVPDGYVRVAEALRELGVSRQTPWSRIPVGSLQTFRVVRGPSRACTSC